MDGATTWRLFCDGGFLRFSGEQCSEQSWEMCSWGCDRRRDLYSIGS